MKNSKENVSNIQNETYGEKLRNWLTPYKNILVICDNFTEGKMSEQQFSDMYKLLNESAKISFENILELSKSEYIENGKYLTD